MKKIIYLFLIVCSLAFVPYVNVIAISTSDLEAESDLYKEQLETIQVINSNNSYQLTDEDVYLIAQVVYAESRSEPYEGKVAVASVILNRLKDSAFPKTVQGVIKQKGAFSCIVNGRINVVPDESSYRAVLEALKGKDPTDKAVFFYNPKIATSAWMKNVDKKGVKTIGNHVFFVVKQ